MNGRVNVSEIEKRDFLPWGEIFAVLKTGNNYKVLQVYVLTFSHK